MVDFTMPVEMIKPMLMRALFQIVELVSIAPKMATIAAAIARFARWGGTDLVVRVPVIPACFAVRAPGLVPGASIRAISRSGIAQ